MTKHRSHSAAIKRQFSEEFQAGETLHGLSWRHDLSRQLIGIWAGRYKAGALDDKVQAANLFQEYEANDGHGVGRGKVITSHAHQPGQGAG